jgi:hypothetical protein
MGDLFVSEFHRSSSLAAIGTFLFLAEADVGALWGQVKRSRCEIMTKPTAPDPLAHITDPAKRAEAEALDTVFRDVTGWAPRSWGTTIGYGRYAYTYASGRSGDCFATGFNIRARHISLHILPGYSDYPGISARLGPHKRGKACWYIKRLAEIDEAALRDLIRAGLDDLAKKWPIEGT